MPLNDRLFDLLSRVGEAELSVLWTEALGRRPSDESFSASPRSRQIDLVSREWRSAHGHSLANLRRDDHDLRWKSILVDVANKMEPGWGRGTFNVGDDQSEERIENAILRLYDQRLNALWQKLPPEEQEELARDLNAEIERSARALRKQGATAAVRGVTVSSLTAGISAGLITGGGLMTIAHGSLGMAIGGLLGGVVQQLGFWMAMQMFGILAGTRMALGGGAAVLGGAAIAAPIGVALLAHSLMSTAYRKSVPATVMLLSWVALHQELSTPKDSA